MVARGMLLKKYQHPNKMKPWFVGTIVQGTGDWISGLVHDGIAEIYTGEYPPKKKMKFELKQLK